MVTWSAFAAADPALAAIAEARFDGPGLVLLGTLRANGFPRISPIEHLFRDGRLELGMMWQSRKAVDLQRDQRCVVHSATLDKDGKDGDVKVYGLGIEEHDPDEREAYCVALEAKIGWRPTDDLFHVFVVDVAEAGYIKFGDGGAHNHQVWKPGPD